VDVQQPWHAVMQGGGPSIAPSIGPPLPLPLPLPLLPLPLLPLLPLLPPLESPVKSVPSEALVSCDTVLSVPPLLDALSSPVESVPTTSTPPPSHPSVHSPYELNPLMAAHAPVAPPIANATRIPTGTRIARL
jgi:hypothetical protein